MVFEESFFLGRLLLLLLLLLLVLLLLLLLLAVACLANAESAGKLPLVVNSLRECQPKSVLQRL